MNDIDLKNARVAALLNTASGSYSEDAKERLDAILTDAGIAKRKLWVVSPSEVEGALEEIRTYAPTILIVLGGDGTIRCGAETCLDRDTLLVPLPGGTMNMLPKALYGDRSWQEALADTLAAPRVQSVSSGSANGKQFFIAAIVGTPTLWTHAREALREGDVQAAIERGTHAFQNMRASKVAYAFSNEAKGEAAALAALCPLISEEMDNDERALEAATIDVEGIGDALALASTAAFGAWRESAKVTTHKTRSITISANEDIPIILDGESMELGKAVEITFVPEAFKALVPVSA